MNFQEFHPSAKSANWVEGARYALHIAKESLRFDPSRPSEAAERTAERLRKDKIRALVLVGLMFFAWAVIAAIGETISLHPDTVYILCIASGVTINTITMIRMTVEIDSTPSIPLVDRSHYQAPFNSEFTSRFVGPDTPPPRSIS